MINVSSMLFPMSIIPSRFAIQISFFLISFLSIFCIGYFAIIVATLLSFQSLQNCMLQFLLFCEYFLTSIFAFTDRYYSIRSKPVDFIQVKISNQKSKIRLGYNFIENFNKIYKDYHLNQLFQNRLSYGIYGRPKINLFTWF